MKKIIALIIIITLLFNMKIVSAINVMNENTNIYNKTMKQDLLCLMIAYPEYITNIEDKNGYVYLVMKSGKKILYDDKVRKDAQEKIANSDLQDTLEQIYPLSSNKNIMEVNFDPGRSRCYGLLFEVYGTSKKSIESKLTCSCRLQ